MPKNSKADKKSPKLNEASEDSRGASDDDANAVANMEANNESLVQSIASFTRELQDLKKDLKHEFGELKDEVKKNIKEDFKLFKEEMMHELQAHRDDVAQVQTRIAELESASLVMKETLVITMKENKQMHDKMVDLESRSRRNNMRIYGVPEGKEGKSVPEFVSELLETHIKLPEGLKLQIQRAHRALNPKPPPTAAPRSIVVAFLQFQVKECVLRQAWQKKIEMDGKWLFFDNDYASEIMEKRKAYIPIKTALKAKGIRFQTPYTKMRVFWDSGVRSYDSADDVAQELIKRGIMTSWTVRKDHYTTSEEKLNELMPWTRATKDTGQRARERLTGFRRDQQ